ncbi:hypothetical protein M3J09_001319 [Ascochyta lentis]
MAMMQLSGVLFSALSTVSEEAVVGMTAKRLMWRASAVSRKRPEEESSQVWKGEPARSLDGRFINTSISLPYRGHRSGAPCLLGHFPYPRPARHARLLHAHVYTASAVICARLVPANSIFYIERQGCRQQHEMSMRLYAATQATSKLQDYRKLPKILLLCSISLRLSEKHYDAGTRCATRLTGV